MEYQYIVNPLTNRKCNINSRSGKKVLNEYLNLMGGGPDASPLCKKDGECTPKEKEYMDQAFCHQLGNVIDSFEEPHFNRENSECVKHNEMKDEKKKKALRTKIKDKCALLPELNVCECLAEWGPKGGAVEFFSGGHYGTCNGPSYSEKERELCLNFQKARHPNKRTPLDKDTEGLKVMREILKTPVAREYCRRQTSKVLATKAYNRIVYYDKKGNKIERDTKTGPKLNRREKDLKSYLGPKMGIQTVGIRKVNGQVELVADCNRKRNLREYPEETCEETLKKKPNM